MEIKDIINRVNIYGFEESIRGSKFPMATDLKTLTTDFAKSTVRLGTSAIGEGHDNFLNGIIVQFDLTFSNKAWVEMQRYHFIDFVSSQSTMHRITRFDLDQAYMEYVDPRIINIMKEKVAEYNTLLEKSKEANTNEYNEELKKRYLEILYSNPAGFRLTARMTTNYRQLKTIYAQRKNHRLPEWRIFCAWCETLPHSEFITRKLPESSECTQL